MVGTILPNRKQLALADRHADDLAIRNDKLGSLLLPNCERRVVGGEVRYYDTTDQYAVVSRRGTLVWFAVREDGDYRIN